MLRLQNPYDPTNDAGKKIHFKDKIFNMGAEGGGVYGWNGSINAYIATASKEIKFNY